MNELILEYGSLGLFAVSFLAATIIPFSSEGALSLGLFYGLSEGSVLLYASLGNVAGIIFNYAVGALVAKSLVRRKKSKIQIKVETWIEKWGIWTLLLSWLPIIGDPITIAAGYFRIRFVLFLIFAGSLRVLRYAAVIYVFNLIAM